MFMYKARVVRVVDGDTVDVTIDLGFKINTVQRLRIKGINAPERGVKGWEEANAALTTLIPPGTDVTVKTYKTEKYGRWLGDIILTRPNGLSVDVGQFMLDEGFAKSYDD